MSDQINEIYGNVTASYHEPRGPWDALWSRLCFVLRIQRYSLPFWHNILLRLILEPIGAMVPIVLAFIARYAVNEAFPAGDVGGWRVCTMAVFALAVLMFMLGFTPAAMMFEMAVRQELALRDRLFRHMMRLSLRFHGKRPVGENVFRLSTGDTSKFSTNIVMLGQDAFDTIGLTAITPVRLISNLIKIVLVISVMTIVSRKIALMIVVYVAVYMVINHWLMTYVQRANRISRTGRQDVEARARESLTLFKITKAFCRQIFENSRFFRSAADAMRKNLRNQIWATFQGAVGLGLNPIFILVCGYVAGVEVFAGTMTPGDYVVFPPLVASLMAPVSIAYAVIQGSRIRFVASDRVMQTLQADPEIVDAPDAQPLPSVQGEIGFNRVTFGYDPDKPVLHNMSFRIAPGQKVAFVGPSGAGKTSIVNLLMRFYDPDSGSVLIDGKNIRDVRLRDLRDQLGMVLQDSILFSGSILSNIKYGKPSATTEEVQRAARIADIHDFIQTLPQGYDTPLSESGELSGGQKQRIAIARAIIREPRILILDEATAAVDPLVEREIISAVNEYAKDRTVVVIAHNLINVRDADRIFVIDEGRIVQEGVHDDLMARDGLYRRMWTEKLDQQE